MSSPVNLPPFLPSSTIFQTMSTVQKAGKRDRVFAPFRGSLSNSDQHRTSRNQCGVESAIPASDKARTRERYFKAVSLLENALKGRNDKWGDFEIPKLKGELENVNPSEFKGKMEALCQLYSQKRDRDALEECAHVIECCFTAFRPFAKNFLSIARDGAQVIRVRLEPLTLLDDNDTKSLRIAFWRPHPAH
jgi:hypothetical protein